MAAPTGTGLSSTGFTKPRAADWLAVLQAAYLTELAARGLPTDIDFDRNGFEGPLFVALAAAFGDISDILQALWDMTAANNATGVQLDNLSQLVGVNGQGATKSTATVTLSGTAATIVPANAVVSGGGTDGAARWLTTADATIGGGGTVDVTVEAEAAGATEALAAEIDTIVTPVTGWTAVTNAAAATVGQANETDADLRTRRAASLQIRGASALKAIRANLLALDYIDAASVIHNPSPTTDVIEGLTLDPHSLAVVVYPEPSTDARKAEVAQTIWSHAPPLKLVGTGVTATVTAGDGVAVPVAYDVAATVAVTVVVVVTLESGYGLGDVDTVIQAAITAHFAALDVGEDVEDLDLYALIAAVPGVKRVTTLTLDGGTAVTATAAEVLTLSGTPSVTL